MPTFKNSRSYSVVVGGSFVVEPGEEIDTETGEPVKPKATPKKAAEVVDPAKENES